MEKKTQYSSFLILVALLFLSFYYSSKMNNIFFPNAGKNLPTTVKQKTKVLVSPDKDLIKNTIKTPESPVTGANVPNSIKDIKASNPSVGVQAMALPMGNNMGTANLQFPIKLPTGRNGMQPQVTIQYNSEGGNGWLGLGWDVSFPSIGIETRWGVPRYEATLETETYTMGGEQLTPVAHREEWVSRTAEKRFFPRREGSFDEIIRHGSSPKSYWWEIIAKNGTRSFYGGISKLDETAVLKDDDGNIAQWALVEVRDNNDNFMRYRYKVVEDNGLQGSTVKGTQLYIDEITYTGHKNTEGVYSVRFIRDRQLNETKRADVSINARLGFKQVTADLLRKIEVNFKETPVRSYELTYKQGAFYKTLFATIAEFDKNGKLFYKHDLDYFDEVRRGQEYYPFKPQKDWTIPFDDVKGRMLNGIDAFNGHASAISGARSNTWNLGIGLRVGFYDGFLTSPSNTIGGSFSYSKAESDGLIALVDINGDGLPDKVFKGKDSLYYRPNIKGSMLFGVKRGIKGIKSFSHSKTTSKTWGVDGYPGYIYHVGKNWTNSKTTVDTYFIDYNGDGLIDIASNGIVHFNHIINGEPEFTTDSKDTPVFLHNSGSIHDSIAPIDTTEFQRLIDENPLHDVVRMWKVPYKGTIRIDAPVRLLLDTNALNYKKNDGVIVTIQHKGKELWRNSINSNDFDTKYPTNVSNIAVDTGQNIYFRVQSRFDGAYDQVSWSPQINYTRDITPDIDANNKPVHLYEASKDYIVASPQFVGMPSAGRVFVKSKFKKPITSDDITLEIYKRKGNDDERIYDKLIKWNDTLTSFTDIGIDVNEKDELKFRIQASTEIDWSNIQWIPRLYYSSSANDTTGVDVYPAVEYTIYNDILKRKMPIVAAKTGLLKLNPVIRLAQPTQQSITLPPSGEITLSVKGRNRLYGKTTIKIVQGNIQVDSSIQVTVTKGDSLYIEYHIANKTLAKLLNDIRSTASANLDIEGSSDILSPSIISRLDSNKVIFGALYRGWGQFAYNGNREKADEPIKENELKFDENRYPKKVKDEDNGDELSKEKFIVMTAHPKTLTWRGNDEFTYIAADTISSSRMGEDDILPSSILEDTRAVVPYLVTKTKSTGIVGGITFPENIPFISGASASKSNGESRTLLKWHDINGDGVNELVGERFIQYTMPRGGWDKRILAHDLGKTSSKTDGFGFFLSGSIMPNKNSLGSSMKLSTSATLSASMALSVEGNYSKSNEDLEHNWIDMNGDGLVDKVYKDGIVSLNMGYKFTKPETWNFTGIQKGRSTDFGAGSSPLGGGITQALGKTMWNGSVSIGFSLQRTENKTIRAMQDANGDGLIDLIISTKPYIVKLNTGVGFGSEILWNGVNLDYDAGESVSEALNIAFTIGIYIPIPFTPGLKIGINPSGSLGEGASRQLTQLSDIDGDGFPDFLNSDKDDNLKVMSSSIGKTNMLKSVKRPFGSFFALDYIRIGNTYDMPNSKWVLTQTSLFDGLKGDGADTMKYRFEYENGKYDRRERDFYGFETVKTHQLNTEKQDVLYRTTVQVFNNSNYYVKGLLLNEWVQDEAGKKYTETRNTYSLKHITTGATLPSNFFTNDNGKNAFTALVASEKLFFEGQNTAGITTKTNYGYDKTGNISDFEDFGDGTTNDYIKAKIEYHNNAVTKSEPSQIEVFTKEGLMRKRQTSINEEGNVTQIRQYFDGNTSANFDMEYDVYGNMTKTTRPENHDKKRFFYEYTYDDVVHYYVVAVKDAYGYSSKSEYEFVFGQLLESTDMNGHKIKYTIDDLGRIKTITGTFELAVGKPYTIAFEYNTEATIPYAITKHYDPEHNSDIKTITFVDGLMRPVQVKKTGSLFNTEGGTDIVKMIVSGRIKFDAFGRTTETYYPNTEGVGNETQLNPTYNPISPTKASYDVLDRTLTTTLPDNAKTTMRYEIGKDKTGYTAFKTTMIDALNNKKETYTDVRNRNRANVDFGDDGDIWTQFSYNALSELMTVTDNSNHKTAYQYDKLGRKTSIKHPDAGETTFEYDIVGNLTKKVTADIRKKIPNGGAIKYTYDYERLVQIDYPRNFQNRVRYTYGKSGDKFNRAGRIVLQQDGSGGQEFYYGKLGEITKTIRTIYVNPTTVLTYISEAEYDTWNRLKTMTYPDGEKLVYKYNQAGKLLSMSGKKMDTTYNYVAQVGYDEFEQRTFLKYGNGSVTRYKYENERRRLNNMTVYSKGANIINNRYAYDQMNNVLSVENAISGDNLKMGGPAKHNYRYDKLYRLTQAEGFWRRETRQDNYTLNMSYDNLHNITEKVQTHTQRGRNVKETTYSQEYFYNSQNQPHAPNKIGKELYTYDANGNLTESKSENAFALNRQLLTWDEENRLMNISKNGIISQFTYDAQGERVIKSSGNFTGVYINGALAGALGHQKNYTLYVSPYLVVREGEFSKHYYIEGQRIVSKIGVGEFKNQDWNKTLIKAGNIDYAATFKDMYDQAKDFFRGFGNPPGQPTKPYIYAHPDSTGIPTPSVSTPSITSSDTLVRFPVRAPTNGPPGAPIQFKMVHRDSLGAGYGFENNVKKPETRQFYYHPDHLGSTSYITDMLGDVYQHMEYMPFGETFVEETSKEGKQPYLFNGKELDSETGLYYYGARYYNPKISMWLGVDPMAEKYAGWSPYNYTLLNPVKYVDPDGNSAKDFMEIFNEEAAGFGEGFATGVSTFGEGIVEAVKHPINTLQNLGSALQNYDKTYDNLVNSTANDFEKVIDGNATERGEVFGFAYSSVALSSIKVPVKAGQALNKWGVGATFGKRVFYTDGAGELANSFANNTGKYTIDMTRAGKKLTDLQKKGLSWENAYPLWENLSKEWAKSTRGSADFFRGKTPSKSKVFDRIELPILEKNKVKLIPHD
jgi:RHS repeat-associated protein